MQNMIFETLKKIGMASEESQSIYAHYTRDKKDQLVYRDQISGVIYIDNYYCGDDVYQDGGYRQEKESLLKIGKPDYERQIDAKRRLKYTLPYITDKEVLEFGCGRGLFLEMAQPYAKTVCGIELSETHLKKLNSKGIYCANELNSIPDSSLDIIIFFHVLEHLPDPLSRLREARQKLRKGGRIIVEVPHANDFLLTYLACEAFKRHTLWSQHLILHTHESLRRLLEAAGFKNVVISGVQRYTLANHMHWLQNRQPGGHKGTLAAIDSRELNQVYSDSLARIGATDTLFSYAVLDD